MADLSSWLLDRRQEVEARLSKHEMLHTVSAARYQLHRAVGGAIGAHASGRVLEAGAGRSPYRRAMAGRVEEVVTLDIDGSKQVDVVADVQNMGVLADESFDTVVSTQVLEHVPRPADAVKEMRRVLKRGGVLILTVPHLSMVHEAPHDYHRFTRYGLEELCVVNSLEVIDIRPVGGLLSFLGHVMSLGVLMCACGFPRIFWPVWAVNYVLLARGLDVLDRMIGLQTLFPRDHLLVARRA